LTYGDEAHRRRQATGIQRVSLKLADRIYTCAHGGLVIDRDRNASGNILARGKELAALGRQCLGSP
jgi:transposase